MRGFFLITFIFFYACNEDNSIKTYSLPKQKEFPQSLQSKEENLEIPFSWNAPKHWTTGKPSSMRLASYNVPFNRGYADISITNFSGDGGGLLANVNRWRRQLNLEPQSLDQMNKSILIRSSALGDYKVIKIINDGNKESAFLCAILEIKQSTIFIKMNASIEGIDQLEEDFITFCSSFN